MPQATSARSPGIRSTVSRIACSLASLAFLLGAAGRPDRSFAESPSPTADSKPLPPRALRQIGSDLFRCRGSVQAMAFSPDGTWIAVSETNSPERVVRIFEVPTGRELRVLRDPEAGWGWVTALAVAPDGRRLLCGEVGGRIRLLSLPEDKILFQATPHKGSVQSVAFSADGQTFWTTGADGRIEGRQTDAPDAVDVLLKDAEPAPNAPRLGAYSEGGPNSISLSRDNRLLASVKGQTGEIAIWDLKTRERLRTFTPPQQGGGDSFNARVRRIAFAPDGRTLLSCGQQTRKREETTVRYGPKSVTLTQVHLWDVATGTLAKDLSGQDEVGFGYAALSPDGTRVVIADMGVVRIRDASSGKTLHELPVPGDWGDLPEISPDGKIAAIGISSGVMLIDTATGRPLSSDPLLRLGSILSAAWSPDGDRVLTGHTNGEVCLWQAATGERLWSHELAPVLSPGGWSAAPYFVGFSQDGRFVFAAGRRDDPVEYREGVLAALDTATGERWHTTITKRAIRGAAIAPNGRSVVVATTTGGLGDTRLHGVDLESGQIQFSTAEPEGRPGLWSAEAIQYSRDSQTIRVATGDSAIVRFDARTGEEQGRLSIDPRPPAEPGAKKSTFQLWNGEFIPQVFQLMSSSEANLYFWDLNTGRLEQTIVHPNKKGGHSTVAADGRTIATADLLYVGDWGQDTIRLIDRLSGNELLKLEPKDRRATVLTFSPDGTRLFTGFDGGGGMIWDVSR